MGYFSESHRADNRKTQTQSHFLPATSDVDDASQTCSFDLEKQIRIVFSRKFGFSLCYVEHDISEYTWYSSGGLRDCYQNVTGPVTMKRAQRPDAFCGKSTYRWSGVYLQSHENQNSFSGILTPCILGQTHLCLPQRPVLDTLGG